MTIQGMTIQRPLRRSDSGKDVCGQIANVRFYSGKIKFQGNSFYICQDSIAGQNCSDKLGYIYSWCVGDGSILDLSANSVRELMFKSEWDDEVNV
jgi:hypothetical protein